MMKKKGIHVVGLIAYAAATVTCVHVVQATNNVAEAKPAGALFVPRLTSDAMCLLKELLEANPICIMRIDAARLEMCKMLKQLESEQFDATMLVQQRSKLVAPLKQFFDDIKKYSSVAVSLIQESMFSKDGAKISTEQRAKIAKESILLQLFTSKTTAIDKFFEERITCKEDLKKTCNEVLSFFGDIKASLPEDTIKIYREFVASLRTPNAKR